MQEFASIGQDSTTSDNQRVHGQRPKIEVHPTSYTSSIKAYSSAGAKERLPGPRGCFLFEGKINSPSKDTSGYIGPLILKQGTSVKFWQCPALILLSFSSCANRLASASNSAVKGSSRRMMLRMQSGKFLKCNTRALLAENCNRQHLHNASLEAYKDRGGSSPCLRN